MTGLSWHDNIGGPAVHDRRGLLVTIEAVRAGAGVQVVAMRDWLARATS